MTKTITSTLLLFSLLTISLTVEAQQRVTGQVTEELDGTPIPFATVFISGTTIGTQTDIDGNFSLTVPIQGSFEIAVSHIGFLPVSHTIDTPQSSHQINFALQERADVLAEVVVTPCLPHRRRDEDLFWRTILGERPSNRGMQVLNPEVVQFCLRANGILRVFADEPIEIINHDMGYHILYVLESFEHDSRNQTTLFFGMPLFTELTPRNNRQNNRWERRRQEVYSVSLTRFIRSLYQEQLYRNGFFLAKHPVEESRWIQQLSLSRADSVRLGLHRGRTMTTEESFSINQILYRDGEGAHVNIEQPLLVAFLSAPVTYTVFRDPNRVFFNRHTTHPLIRLMPSSDITIFSDGSYSGVLHIREFRNSIIGLRAVLPIEYGVSEDFFLQREIEFIAQEPFEERGLAQGNHGIMVFDFDAGAGVTQDQVAFLTSILTVYLQEEFDVISPEEFDRLFTQRATMTEQQIEVVDSLLNVTKIITGSINIQRREYRILATSIDAETGTIITTVGETGDRFHRVAQQMAQNLIAEMKRSEVPVPQEVAVETLLERVVAERGVLINGVRWATSNVDVQAGTFVPSPEMAGRLNAWGERSVWREIMFVPSERGGAIPTILSMLRGGTASVSDFLPELRTEFERFRDDEMNRIQDVWESFRAIEAIWARNDPCPPGWRIPYPDEFESLIAAGSFWTTVNGVGGRIFGTAPNQIFLPAAGGGGADPTMDHIPTHVAHAGQIGYYWTRNSRLPTSNIAYRLRISQVDATVGVDGHISNLDFGFSVRCVVQTDNIYVEF